MMNKFEKQLEKWNDGTLRGAQAKLARILKVSTATVALWATGKRRPSKGYAGKMADLFKLDVYGVMRLFDASTIYPDVPRPAAARTLCDKENINFAYRFPREHSLPEGAVSLPVLRRPPLHYPDYLPTDEEGPWMMPPAAAKTAQYITRIPGNAAEETQPNVLYFIRPAALLEPGKWMLLLLNGRVLLRRAHKTDGSWLLETENGQTECVREEQIRPLGTAVRKITELE